MSGEKSVSKRCLKRSQIEGWRSSKNLDVSSVRINHEYGPLWVDFGHAKVKRNGRPVYLKSLELRLLRYLIERAGSLCFS